LTDWRNSMNWSFEHPEKHSFPIKSICPWKRMDEREEHPEKQPSGRFLTDWGISIYWSFEHPEKQ
jgi:hypothetical protein